MMLSTSFGGWWRHNKESWKNWHAQFQYSLNFLVYEQMSLSSTVSYLTCGLRHWSNKLNWLVLWHSNYQHCLCISQPYPLCWRLKWFFLWNMKLSSSTSVYIKFFAFVLGSDIKFVSWYLNDIVPPYSILMKFGIVQLILFGGKEKEKEKVTLEKDEICCTTSHTYFLISFFFSFFTQTFWTSHLLNLFLIHSTIIVSKHINLNLYPKENGK